jgi:hypothetical protein
VLGALVAAIVFVCACVGVAPSLARARPAPLLGQWQPAGPSIDGTPIGNSSGLAGRVSAVVAIPGAPLSEIAGTLGGIWVEQGSGPWRDVTNPAWPSTAIGSLAVDPRNPRIVYAGTGYDDVDDSSGQPGAGVMKSTDGGRTWMPLAGSRSMMQGYAVTGLAVEPHNDKVVIAAANNGLFRSADAGQTWREAQSIKPGGDGIAEVHLAIDPATGMLLAGVAQTGGVTARFGRRTIHTRHAVYRSADGGRTWKAFAVDTRTVGGAVLAPGLATARGHTYAYALDVTGGAASGVYTSTDGGRTWRLQTTDTESKFSIGQLVVDPANPRHAYFAQADGPFAYTWGRHTVQLLEGGDGSSPSFGDWRALSIGPAARGTRALYGGDDGGTTFYSFASKVFVNNDAGLVSGLDYFGSARSATFEFGGAQDLGIDLFRGGTATSEMYNADAYGVLGDINRASTYYASVYPPIGAASYVVSHDSGATWHNVRLPTSDSNVYSMAPVQALGASNVLILPDQDGTMYVSTDDGASWQVRTMGSLGGDYLVSVAAALIPGATVPVIYVGTGFGGVWRSGDLGVHWSQLQVTLPNGADSVKDVLIDPSTSAGAGGEHVYLALGVASPQLTADQTVVGGVLESTDSGATWQDLSGALHSTSVNTLLIDGATLLAGTDHGVAQDVNGSWSPVATGFPNVPVNDLFLSQDQSALFATTYGRGTQELVLIPTVGGVGRSAPRNIVPPRILGTPVVGRTLSGSTGQWVGSPHPRFRFQWQRCRQRCVNIAGATGRTYTLGRADRGTRVRVVVRAHNRVGARSVASTPALVHVKPFRVGTV